MTRLRLVLSLAALLVATAPAAQTYRIDPARSTLVYAMSHPAHDWTGTSRRVSGTLTVADGRLTGGRVAAPVTSFDSGNRSRDSNMATDTDAYLYPTVTFEARSVTPGDGGRATVRGTLTFHGVARPVEMPATVDVTGDAVRVRGTFDVTLSAFGLSRPSLLGVRTRDWIGLTVDLVATPSTR